MICLVLVVVSAASVRQGVSSVWLQKSDATSQVWSHGPRMCPFHVLEILHPTVTFSLTAHMLRRLHRIMMNHDELWSVGHVEKTLVATLVAHMCNVFRIFRIGTMIQQKGSGTKVKYA